jgi:predicted CXXCH cytochrome family protein
MRLSIGSLSTLALLGFAGSLAHAGPATNSNDSDAQRCYGCHKETEVKATQHVHAPVAMDACSQCHTPHAGKNTRSTLTAKGDDLCFSCHDDADYRGKFEHARGKSGCVGCHSPHSGTSFSLLRTSATKLCASCHTAPAKHKGDQRAGGDCTGCHDVHGAKRPGMLRKRTVAGACRRDRNVVKPTRIAGR